MGSEPTSSTATDAIQLDVVSKATSLAGLDAAIERLQTAFAKTQLLHGALDGINARLAGLKAGPAFTRDAATISAAIADLQKTAGAAAEKRVDVAKLLGYPNPQEFDNFFTREKERLKKELAGVNAQIEKTPGKSKGPLGQPLVQKRTALDKERTALLDAFGTGGKITSVPKAGAFFAKFEADLAREAAAAAKRNERTLAKFLFEPLMNADAVAQRLLAAMGLPGSAGTPRPAGADQSAARARATQVAPTGAPGQGTRPTAPEFKLPPALAQIKPRIGRGNNNFEIAFESELDKAAYTLAQRLKNKRHPEILEAVKTQTGMAEQDITAHGMKVKEQLKRLALEAIKAQQQGPLKLAKQEVDYAFTPALSPLRGEGAGTLGSWMAQRSAEKLRVESSSELRDRKQPSGTQPSTLNPQPSGPLHVIIAGQTVPVQVFWALAAGIGASPGAAAAAGDARKPSPLTPALSPLRGDGVGEKGPTPPSDFGTVAQEKLTTDSKGKRTAALKQIKEDGKVIDTTWRVENDAWEQLKTTTTELKLKDHIEKFRGQSEHAHKQYSTALTAASEALKGGLITPLAAKEQVLAAKAKLASGLKVLTAPLAPGITDAQRRAMTNEQRHAQAEGEKEARRVDALVRQSTPFKRASTQSESLERQVNEGRVKLVKKVRDELEKDTLAELKRAVAAVDAGSMGEKGKRGKGEGRLSVRQEAIEGIERFVPTVTQPAVKRAMLGYAATLRKEMQGIEAELAKAAEAAIEQQQREVKAQGKLKGKLAVSAGKAGVTAETQRAQREQAEAAETAIRARQARLQAEGFAVVRGSRTETLGGKRPRVEEEFTASKTVGSQVHEVKGKFVWEGGRASIAQLKETTRALKDVREEASYAGRDFIRNTQTVTAWAASVYLYRTALGVAQSGLRAFVDTGFETARLEQIFSKVGGTTQQLTDDTLRLAAANGRSSAEAFESAKAWARFGLTRAQVNEAVRVSLVAVNVAELSGAEATNYLSSILQAYNLQVGDLAGVLGRLNAVSNVYNVTTGNLLEGISRTAATAKSAGLSLTELTGLIGGTVGATGQTGANIGNAIKSITLALSNPALQKSLKQEFEFTVTTPGGELKGLSQTLAELFVRYNELSKIEQQHLVFQIAGKTQGNRLQAVLDNYIRSMSLAIQANLNLNSAEAENAKIKASLKSQLQGLVTEFERFSVVQGNQGPGQFIGTLVTALKNALRLSNTPGFTWLTTALLGMFGALAVKLLMTSAQMKAAAGTAGFMANSINAISGSAARLNLVLTETLRKFAVMAATGGKIGGVSLGPVDRKLGGAVSGMGRWAGGQAVAGETRRALATGRASAFVPPREIPAQWIAAGVGAQGQTLLERQEKQTLPGMAKQFTLVQRAGMLAFGSIQGAVAALANTIAGVVVALRSFLVVGLAMGAIYGVFSGFNYLMERIGLATERSTARLAGFNQAASEASAAAEAAGQAITLLDTMTRVLPTLRGERRQAAVEQTTEAVGRVLYPKEQALPQPERTQTNALRAEFEALSKAAAESGDATALMARKEEVTNDLRIKKQRDLQRKYDETKKKIEENAAEIKRLEGQEKGKFGFIGLEKRRALISELKQKEHEFHGDSTEIINEQLAAQEAGLATDQRHQSSLLAMQTGLQAIAELYRTIGQAATLPLDKALLHTASLQAQLSLLNEQERLANADKSADSRAQAEKQVKLDDLGKRESFVREQLRLAPKVERPSFERPEEMDKVDVVAGIGATLSRSPVLEELRRRTIDVKMRQNLAWKEYDASEAKRLEGVLQGIEEERKIIQGTPTTDQAGSKKRLEKINEEKRQKEAEIEAMNAALPAIQKQQEFEIGGRLARAEFRRLEYEPFGERLRVESRSELSDGASRSSSLNPQPSTLNLEEKASRNQAFREQAQRLRDKEAARKGGFGAPGSPVFPTTFEPPRAAPPPESTAEDVRFFREQAEFLRLREERIKEVLAAGKDIGGAFADPSNVRAIIEQQHPLPTRPERPATDEARKVSPLTPALSPLRGEGAGAGGRPLLPRPVPGFGAPVAPVPEVTLKPIPIPRKKPFEGRTEAERALNFQAGLEHEIELQRRITEVSRKPLEIQNAKIKLNAALAEQSENLLRLEEMRHDVGARENQLIVERRKEMQKSLMLAGPGDMLRKLAAFQMAQKPVTPGAFMAASPAMRREMQQHGVFDPEQMALKRDRNILGPPQGPDAVNQAVNKNLPEKFLLAQSLAKDFTSLISATALSALELSRFQKGVGAAATALEAIPKIVLDMAAKAFEGMKTGASPDARIGKRSTGDQLVKQWMPQ